MTPLARLRAMEPPPVVWRFGRAVAVAILHVHPRRNPQTGQGWTIEQLAGETYAQWQKRMGRA